MPRHSAKRAVFEEHVRIDDEHGFGPRLGEDLREAVVERVGLALAALFATKMPDALRHARFPARTTSGVASVDASSTTYTRRFAPG